MDLSLGASERKGKRAAVCRARPSLRSPWAGARVGSHRCPILRPGQTSIARKNNPKASIAKENHPVVHSTSPVGLPGYLPLCLCVREERLFEFRGAAAAALGKISDVANSMAALASGTSQVKGLSYPRGPATAPRLNRECDTLNNPEPSHTVATVFCLAEKTTACGMDRERRTLSFRTT